MINKHCLKINCKDRWQVF